MVQTELRNMGAPASIVDAGKTIDESRSAGLMPSRDLIQLVITWVAKYRGNNRYGK